MTNTNADLPHGWFLLEGDSGRGFEAELASELPSVHYLKGVPVQAFAKDDASDDVLFRHVNEPDHWSVVHLTWIGKQEQPPFPCVEFTGTFAEFCRQYHSDGDGYTRPEERA